MSVLDELKEASGAAFDALTAELRAKIAEFSDQPSYWESFRAFTAAVDWQVRIELSLHSYPLHLQTAPPSPRPNASTDVPASDPSFVVCMHSTCLVRARCLTETFLKCRFAALSACLLTGTVLYAGALAHRCPAVPSGVVLFHNPLQAEPDLHRSRVRSHR